MGRKQNCWEYNNCGREPEGTKVHKLGVCPAVNIPSLNGINGGKNSALLAVNFLSLIDESIHKKLIEFRKNAEEASMQKNDNLKYS